MNQALLSPISALLAHIESLVSGRRILVVGNAGNSIAAHLIERGARLVQVLDPDSRRVAIAAAQNTERKVTFSQLTPHSLRDGSFELALIEDIELADHFEQLILGVKRSLGSSGIAIFCARNAESTSGLLGAGRGGISYDDFGDALWDQFENVSVWGQSPFLGYSIVQFGLDQPPEPVLDNGYIGDEGEPADYYIAICDSQDEQLPLSEMSIVQLPSARLLSDSENKHREKERKAARRVEGLEQEIAQLRHQVSSSEVDRLVAQLEQRDVKIRQLEKRAALADDRVADADADIEELEKELEVTHTALVARGEELDELKSSGGQAGQELKAAQATIARLEKQLKEARAHEEEVEHLSEGRKALEDELNQMAEKNEALLKKLKHQEAQADKFKRRVDALDTEVDDLHKQLDETEGFLRDAEDELSEGQAKWTKAQAQLKELHASAQSEQEVSALEEQLTERGKRVLELESQLRKLENYCRTLKAELKTPSWVAEDGLQAEFEQMARTLAEREADLVEAEWTIGQLRRSNNN